MSKERLDPVHMAIQAHKSIDPDEAARLKTKSLNIMWSTRRDLGMCSNLLALIIGGPIGYQKIISGIENGHQD